MTILAIRARRDHGYFLIGWLWYVGTLIPVIGLIQVGAQSMADRYTYVPSIGLFLIAAWGAPELLARWQVQPDSALPNYPGPACLACATLAKAQVEYWSDETLWQHALDVTQDNYVAHTLLGDVPRPNRESSTRPRSATQASGSNPIS